MKKLIKNYTTEIPVEQTIAEIQQMLAQNGARGIALEYDENGHIQDIVNVHVVAAGTSC